MMQYLITHIFLIATFLLPLVQTQSTFNLTCSTPYQQQATGSSIVVSCTCFPGNRTLPLLEWKINNRVIGFVEFAHGSNRLEAPIISTPSVLYYINRVNISAAGTVSHFTTQLNFTNLNLNDTGLVIALRKRWLGKVTRVVLLNVTDCPSNLESNVAVRSSRPAVFQSSGMFNCSNNGELFYSNGSMLTTSDTVCLASAEWSGQENLQCWSAPVTAITSSLTVIEGNKLMLTCDYTDTVPIGNSTKFHIGDTSNTTRKGESLTLSSVGRNDNNKIISCQALTPYTRIRGNAGRSLNYSLNVQYAPYQEPPIPSQTWEVNQVGQFAVTFMSNPQAQYVSLTKNRTLVTNDISNEISSNDVMQTYQFMRRVVSYADEGRYVLTVQSSAFPNNYAIYFDVDVVGNLPTNPKSNQSLIIGVSCAAVVIVIILVIVVILMMKKRNTETNKVTSEQAQCTYRQPVIDEPGYIEFNQENLPVQRVPKYINVRHDQHETHQHDGPGPVADENGYLELNQPPAKKSRVYVNTKETKKYENVEEAYEPFV